MSAVPAGEVIARDDVFGMMTPAAVTIGTTMSVVRFPGRPPTLCLSMTGERPQSSRSPLGHHRQGQVDHLLAVEPLAAAGGEKRREVDVGVAAGRDVVHDRAEAGRVEPLAVDLRADVPERVERQRVGELHRRSFRGELGPGALRQSGVRHAEQVRR